jgi:tetratricopeptide (TPR) repeat protein
LGIADPEHALSYHEEALAIRRRTLPPDHPDLADGLNNVAYDILAAGRLDQARQLSEEAVAVAEKSYGPAHGKTGFFIDTLAQILRRQGRLEEADHLSARAIPICEGFWGPSSPFVAEVLLTRALVQRDLGHSSDAQALFERTLRIFGHDTRPGGSDRLIGALREYVVLLKQLGRSDAAAEAEARIRSLEAHKDPP